MGSQGSQGSQGSMVLARGSEIELELQDLAKAIDKGYTDDLSDYNPSDNFCEQVEELWDKAQSEIALGWSDGNKYKERIVKMLQSTLKKWAWYQSKRSGFIVPYDDLQQEYNVYLLRMLEWGNSDKAWNVDEGMCLVKNLRVHLCGSKGSLTANLYRKYKRIQDNETPLCPDDNSQKSILDRTAETKQVDTEFMVDLQRYLAESHFEQQDIEIVMGLATGEIEKAEIPAIKGFNNRMALKRYMDKLATAMREFADR